MMMDLQRKPGETFPAYYRRLTAEAGGVCPIEAGFIGNLADNECKHGRLAGDKTPPCGCWSPHFEPMPEPLAEVIELELIGPFAPARRAA
jgi:hypothetical protein